MLCVPCSVSGPSLIFLIGNDAIYGSPYTIIDFDGISQLMMNLLNLIASTLTKSLRITYIGIITSEVMCGS